MELTKPQTPGKSVMNTDPTHINSLNSDCFRLLFIRLPLQSQIRARAVCHQWKFYLETLLLNKRKSLKLFTGFGSVIDYCAALEKNRLHEDVAIVDRVLGLKHSGNGADDDLLFDASIKSEDTLPEFLVDLFPNVHKLVLAFDTHVDIIGSLLNCWSHLTVLVLNYTFPENSGFIIWTKIASLKSLQEMHLIDCANVGPIPRVVLSRLTSFTATSLEENCFEWILFNLGKSCKKLCFQNVLWSSAQFYFQYFERSIKANAALCNAVTHFTFHLKHQNATELYTSGVEFAIFQLVTENFTKLEYLDICPDFTLAGIASSLAGLSHLTEVRLHLLPSHFTTAYRDSRFTIAKTNGIISKLESITTLHLIIDKRYFDYVVTLQPENDEPNDDEDEDERPNNGSPDGFLNDPNWLLATFPNLTELYVKCGFEFIVALFDKCIPMFSRLNKSVLVRDEVPPIDRQAFTGRHFQLVEQTKEKQANKQNAETNQDNITASVITISIRL